MSGPLADDVRGGRWPQPDGKPELNPAALVADVIELLRQRGLDVNTTINPTVLFAAGDLPRRSDLAKHKALKIVAYEYDAWPAEPAIAAFEALAGRRLDLSTRQVAGLQGLVHPIHQAGAVFAWEVHAADPLDANCRRNVRGRSLSRSGNV